jgi:hypothetical protein
MVVVGTVIFFVSDVDAMHARAIAQGLYLEAAPRGRDRARR